VASAPQPLAAVIVEETRLLDAAKSALAVRPAETRRLVDEHERRFPDGHLAQEREVIAIEALTRTGQQDEARARGAVFQRRFPRSAHLRRVQALLAR
jgi:hypothetical protein